jgi:protein-disulfide isomerase
LFIAVTFTFMVARAAAAQPAEEAGAPSFQQQIDELKLQQQQILRELEDLKALVQGAPKRADYPTRPVPATNITLGVHGELFRGSSNAPLAIIEYSDFECSFCARFATEIYPRIDADYIQTGKVKYFFRDLPAPEHTNSFFKARVARCAGDQGLFWEMHDWLFIQGPKSTAQDIEAEGKALGLDIPEFNGCLSNDRFTSNIQRSITGARRMGLQGTPAFLIGILDTEATTVHVAQVLLGADSYEPFRQALDKLAGPGPAADSKQSRAQP